MSISKKYCQPCGAPPNIYDDGHIILLSQNCRDCIQPCSTLRLIPAQVHGGVLTSFPPRSHFQPMRSLRGLSSSPELEPSRTSTRILASHWLSALTWRGFADIIHTFHASDTQFLDIGQAEHILNLDQPPVEWENQTPYREDPPTEDKSTAQHKSAACTVI